MNIETAINAGAKILKDKYIRTANLDSEILMSKAINKNREFILLNLKKNINKQELLYFQTLIKKRSLRKPIAYLTNKKFFWDSEFFVTKDTLIPRPETELIVQSTLNSTKYKNKLNILDIGIGSGCILLSILKERKNFYGTGIDISKNCLKISKINAINIGVSNRLKLFKSNVDKFNFGKYDLIVSNPPYINKNDIKYLERDIVGFEPLVSLKGGQDGASVLNKVIKKSSSLIKIGGKLVLEIGYNQKYKVMNLLMKKKFHINKIIKDYSNNDRCIIATKL